jgi:hypothetical protein
MSPDITMCPGTNCPHKETCYRYTAKPSEYQSYFTEAPVKDEKCDMYWGANAKSVWKQINEIIETKK